MIDLWPLPVLWAMAISVWASFMAGVIKVIIPRGVAHTQSSSLSGSLKVQAIPATKIRRQINIVSVLYSSENITFNWISHMSAKRRTNSFTFCISPLSLSTFMAPSFVIAYANELDRLL